LPGTLFGPIDEQANGADQLFIGRRDTERRYHNGTSPTICVSSPIPLLIIATP
jgi:hypothetical protein